jgi:hypothetical protein
LVDREIPTNAYVRIMPNVKCNAEANNGFQFASWIENLGRNSTRRINASTTSNPLFTPILYALGISPNDNAVVLGGSFSAIFEGVFGWLIHCCSNYFYRMVRPKYCTLDKL